VRRPVAIFRRSPRRFALCYRCEETEGRSMAKNGFRLVDAEMHVMEPPDLWHRYIDP
jgi:hypothetical protein